MIGAGRLDDRGWVAALSVLALAAAVHLPFVGEIGLFNDDVVQFLQPHHAAAGHPLRFVVTDSTTNLPSGERPVAYLPFALARGAYLLGIHWLVALQILAAGVAAAYFSRVVWRLTGNQAAALVAGAFVVLWPVSPLVSFWPSTIHYPFAMLLVLGSVDAALAPGATRRWLAIALHTGAVLTLESCLLAAPVLLVGVAGARRLGLPAPDPRAPQRSGREVASTAIWMAVASGLIVVWRFLVLPRLALLGLHYEGQVVPWRSALQRVFGGVSYLLDPWAAAAAVEGELWPEGRRAGALAAVAITVAVGVVLAVLAERSRRSRPQATRPGRRLLALLPGALYFLYWVGILSWIPGTFREPVGLASRLDYPAVFGVGLLAAGLVHFVVRPGRGAFRAGLRILVVLGVAMVVYLGIRYQRSILAAHAVDWQRTRQVMIELGETCPSIASDTLVVLDSDWPTSLLRVARNERTGMSHQVLSSLLIARYDDPSLRGVRKRELAMTEEGVFPLHFGAEATWFAPGGYGPIMSRATVPEGPIDPARVLVLGWRHSDHLEVVPAVSMSAGKHEWRRLESRPGRCTAGQKAPSGAFCHAFPEICRSPA